MQLIKRFFYYILQYRLLLALTLITNILFAITSNIVPLSLRDIVDSATETNFDQLASDLIILVALVVISMLGAIFTQYIADLLIIKASSRVKQDVFKHMHDLDFQYHADKSSGRLISIFRRGENAFITFFEEIIVWASRVFIDFFIIIFIFSQVYPRLLTVTVVVFVLNLVFIYFTVGNNIKKRKVFNDTEDEVSAMIVDNMIAFDTVKYFAQEKFEQRRMAAKMKIWVRQFIEYCLTFRVIDLVNGGLAKIGMLVTIVIASLDLIHNQISAGDFVLAITFATTFYQKVEYLVFRFRETAKNFEDLKRYLYLLDEKIQVKDGSDRAAFTKLEALKSPAQIEFKDVSFSYNPRNVILSGVDLTIKPGESVAFVGHSGVGKTTLVKLLLRFYDVNQGAILINGVDITSISKERLRSLIAMVPQEAALFNNTIGYNMGYAKAGKYTKAELDNAAKQAYLYDFIQELPDRYDTEIGERGIKLSGGQKQRLSIARAFLKDAPIIVFDEATSNLDSDSEQVVQKAFFELIKNKTTIIIAHRLSTIRKVDRIVVFDKGQIVEQGSHHELINKDSGIYKHLWELQSSGEMVE